MNDLEQEASEAINIALMEAEALIASVRRGGGEEEIRAFVRSAQGMAREIDAAMAEATASMERTGEIGAAEFSKVYRTGCAHSFMVSFCRDLAGDAEERVRLAAALGEIALQDIDRSEGAKRVVRAIQARLDNANG